MRYWLAHKLFRLAARVYPLRPDATTGASHYVGQKWLYWRLDGSDVKPSDPRLRKPDVRWGNEV